MKKRLSIAFAALLACSAVHAQTSDTDAMPFLQLDFDHASLAMGSSSIPTAATLPLGDMRIAGGVGYTSYMPKLDGTRYMSAEVAGTVSGLGLSLGAVRGTGAEISGLNFTPSELIVNAGLSYGFAKLASLGVNVKYGKEDLLEDYSNSAVAADIFAACKLSDFRIVAGVSNIGGKVASDATGDFSLPAAFSLAANYLKVAKGVHHLGADVRIDRYFSGSSAVGIGAQYGFADIIYLRGGYHYGGESIIPSFASAGLGLCIYNVTLDAVCLFASESLQDSFGISLGVRF